jgi:hypothetical protein
MGRLAPGPASAQTSPVMSRCPNRITPASERRGAMVPEGWLPRGERRQCDYFL